MYKRIMSTCLLAAIGLSATDAMATFADLELIRVYYDRNGTEIATDLGNVQTLIASGGTIAGSFADLNSATSYAAYFALDRSTSRLWASNGVAVTPVTIGGPMGLTAIKNGTTNMYSTYNMQGGTNYTGQASHPNSYKSKISATQGWFANTITAANNARTYSELSLANLSTSNKQTLYFFSNGLSDNATDKMGVAAATLTTNADGSTTISAPPAATAPGAVTSLNAVSSAPMNGKPAIAVSFALPTSNGGSPITGYTVSWSPQGEGIADATASLDPKSLSHVITGLTQGTTYTFSVTATNTTGTGPSSTTSSGIVAASPPGSPASVTATAGDGQATVTFNAPVQDGGVPISSYVVTWDPADTNATDSTTPSSSLTHVITGLTNGQAYSFTVKAINYAGLSSSSSAPSQPVIPGTTTSYSISGNAGIAETLLTYANGTSTNTVNADASTGAYTISVPSGWNGTITPTKTGYVFSPTSLSFSTVAADTPSQNFTAYAPLTVSLTGNGHGTVTSTSPASPSINCANGSSTGCSANYAVGEPVSLSAVSDWKSAFTGWTIDGGSNAITPATVAMSIGKTVTANFDAIFKARLLPAGYTPGDAGTPYASIQDAYDAAATGDGIQAQAYAFSENLTFGQAKTVTLTGGLDASYASTTGVTSVNGPLSLQLGAITVTGALDIR